MVYQASNQVIGAHAHDTRSPLPAIQRPERHIWNVCVLWCPKKKEQDRWSCSHNEGHVLRRPEVPSRCSCNSGKESDVDLGQNLRRPVYSTRVLSIATIQCQDKRTRRRELTPNFSKTYLNGKLENKKSLKGPCMTLTRQVWKCVDFTVCRHLCPDPLCFL